MTLLQLEVFVAVVETGSFTRAGEKLRLSQSGVSHTIAGMEEELGISLLTRNRNGIRLTEAGEAILQYARRILTDMDQIKQTAAAAKGLQVGNLRIGSFPSVSAKLLPGMLRLFRDRYPGISLSLFEGSYTEIQAWMMQGAIDLAFLPYPTEGLEMIPLLQDELVAVLPETHPLAYSSEIMVEQITSEPFIMPMAGCEILVGEAFRARDAQPNTQFEVADTSTILSMVTEGLGITVVPQMTLPASMDQLTLRPLKPQVFRHIGLAVRSLAAPPPAVAMFIKEAKHWVEEHPLH
ncbi:LysR family transcriptional regulator [Brevibacillus migulae]|uniref:LysR family transcriptional regulator n=1 Tax=Brevibacillus migulae TaxID=1644114 RepID=UPI00106E80EA|nr:LysR family transcriptional regulator [Brevibacillus migulae]